MPSADVGRIINEADVVPDGICLDAEGAVWVADVVKQRLIRVAAGGRILDELKTNGLCAFACMLGGDDGRTLFACAAPTFDETGSRGRPSLLDPYDPGCCAPRLAALSRAGESRGGTTVAISSDSTDCRASSYGVAESL